MAIKTADKRPAISRKVVLFEFRPTGPLFMVMALLGLVVLACGDNSAVQTVDFSRRIPVAQPGSPPQSTLHVAVAAMISPQRTFTAYHQLLTYIGRQTGRPVEMVQRKTYGEINKLLGSGRIHLAFICAGPYISGKATYGFKALAVPIIRGEPFYRAYLIVHRDSQYEQLEDLRNKVFAFTDPESNTGKLVPTFWLQQMEETPEAFFKRSIYTFSHDNSIMAVAGSLVDGAAVHSQVWEYLNRRSPTQTAQTRVIQSSAPFGNPPMVASAHLGAELQQRIQTVLFEMHQTADGQAILNELMIDRFVPLEEDWYRPIIQMMEES